MMKDRDQKQMALRLSVANRWFPQLEVDVHSAKAIGQRPLVVTDLDVFASMPDEFKGFRSVVFDCKTKARESAVNRAFWLAGVLERMGGDQGFCILKKDDIGLDHRLMANRLGIIVITEAEFELYARVTSPRYSLAEGNVGDIVAWERFLDIPSHHAKLNAGVRFVRSLFWMAEDAPEACRKALASLRGLQPELDPGKPEHVALFLDYCAVFAHSLAVIVCRIFKAYLQPASQTTLSDALLIMLYGGREAYQYRNEMFKRLMSKDPEIHAPDLALPEWDRFLQLVRQLLDAPVQLQHTPLILRECGFSVLQGDQKRDFAKQLCAESPQGARFAVLIPSYLRHAANLPPEFSRIADEILLPLQPLR